MELVVVPNDVNLTSWSSKQSTWIKFGIVREASADVEEEFLKTSSGLWVRVSLMELVVVAIDIDLSSRSTEQGTWIKFGIVREASADVEEKLLQLLVAITIALG